MIVQQPPGYKDARPAMMRVSAKLRAELKIAAAIEERAISDVTEEALRAWLTKFYRRKGMKPFAPVRDP